jgi:hypothetical protein
VGSQRGLGSSLRAIRADRRCDLKPRKAEEEDFRLSQLPRKPEVRLDYARGRGACALGSMDTPTLISNLTKAVAWPAGVVAAVAMLRPALVERLNHLTALRFRGIEAEFGDELARARQSVEDADLAAVPRDAGLTEGESDRFLRLAEVSPRAAVTEAWGLFEAEARDLVEKRRPRRTTTPMAASSLGDALRELGILDAASAQTFYLLRDLRNQAVHEPQIVVTTENAVEYGNLTRALAAQLNRHRGDEG